MAPRPRSCLGCLAGGATGISRLVNLIVLLGSIASIAIFFIIKNNPTFPEGWGFIALGVVTGVCAVFGLFGRGGEFGCCGLHLLLALLSTAGLALSFFVIFIDPNMVLKDVKYDGTNRSQKKTLLWACAGIFFVLFCCQVVLFLLACLIQCCNFHDYYEDLEAPEHQAKERQAAQSRRAKVEGSSAHQLAERMKEKYGLQGGDSAEKL